MITLYHWTKKKHVDSILKNGLVSTGLCSYLTKFPEKWKDMNGAEVLLEVNVSSNIRLSCFWEYRDGTEVLCWGTIPPANIKIKN